MPNNIKCPKCGTEIDIKELIEAGAGDKVAEAVRAERERVLNEQDKVLKEQENILAQKFQRDSELRMAAMQKELAEAMEKLKDYYAQSAKIDKLEREKQVLGEQIKAEMEREHSQRLVEEMQKLQKVADEKYELKIMELQKQLEDQKRLTEEMRQKQEQGSMQLQGEIQELAIEKYLSENFKFDEIKEVGKGDMGADSLQIINTQYRPNCGTIYYESKRTKTFSEAWIQKFKDDIKEKGADIGVLVTAVYPKDMTRMGLRDGIYICSYEEFKALSFILRDTLIRISDTKLMQENRGDKSILLYNYLTSTEFKFQFETIVNAFVTMQQELDSEKRSINNLWKKREKQIQNVLTSTTEMYGAIQGISGNAIQKVEVLELPVFEEA